MLTLYSVILLNLCISSRRFCFVLLFFATLPSVFYIDSYMQIIWKWVILLLSFQTIWTLVLFIALENWLEFLVKFWIVVSGVYILTLFLVVDEKQSGFHTITYGEVICEFLYTPFIRWMKTYSLPRLQKVFVMNVCWILSKAFLRKLILSCFFLL